MSNEWVLNFMTIRQFLLRGLLGLAALLLLLTALLVAVAWAPDQPLSALTARRAPPPSTFINVNGLQVHLRDEGPRDDPVPIVLIHGTSASLHTWEGWVSVLKQQHRVISMDLPGFGLTGPNAQDDYRSQTYVRFMLALLDQLAVKRCVLAGNSLGGDIAWQVAAAAPQRVARLILVDSAGYPLLPESIPLAFQIARTPVLNKLMQVLLTRQIVEDSVRDVYGVPERVTPALVDRYVALSLRAGNRRALAVRMAQTTFGDRAADIANVKLPTLILWGRRDHLIPLSHASRFQHDIAGSELVVFDDLGHVPHEEDPARTVAVVQAFLAH
jgi:pimeloyl-ACP methyl ester carboxylesterase